ncbi:hypothetical protein OG471_01230 [Streptomyces sp. NBC_01336]|uniref:hypothetical protein n=1 Tax=Streptomyces sp. NBC_01336 TaxID=2903829 RepID=UPI002E10B5A6|nr:hypothetical protein OG471_01230 [Streptomyces sp. NBC_01336]
MEQRVQDAVRRHIRTRRYVLSVVWTYPGVREARNRVEAAETELGLKLYTRLQPFQDRAVLRLPITAIGIIIALTKR